MTAFCRECMETEVAPMARDGRCPSCRPPRRHSKPRRTDWRHKADERFRRLVADHQ